MLNTLQSKLPPAVHKLKWGIKPDLWEGARPIQSLYQKTLNAMFFDPAQPRWRESKPDRRTYINPTLAAFLEFWILEQCSFMHKVIIWIFVVRINKLASTELFRPMLSLSVLEIFVRGTWRHAWQVILHLYGQTVVLPGDWGVPVAEPMTII